MNFRAHFDAFVNRRKTRSQQEFSFLFPGDIFQLLELTGEGRSIASFQRREPAAILATFAASQVKV